MRYIRHKGTLRHVAHRMIIIFVLRSITHRSSSLYKWHGLLHNNLLNTNWAWFNIRADGILVIICYRPIIADNYTRQVPTYTLWIIQYMLVYEFWRLKIHNVTVQLFPGLIDLVTIMIRFQLSVASVMGLIILCLPPEVHSPRWAHLCHIMTWFKAH